jgi:hypothetical protein
VLFILSHTLSQSRHVALVSSLLVGPLPGKNFSSLDNCSQLLLLFLQRLEVLICDLGVLHLYDAQFIIVLLGLLSQSVRKLLCFGLVEVVCVFTILAIVD